MKPRTGISAPTEFVPATPRERSDPPEAADGDHTGSTDETHEHAQPPTRVKLRERMIEK